MRSVILQSFLPARDFSRLLNSYQNKLFPTFSEGLALTCSPETDPATMRVRSPEMGTRRILDEEETHPTADRPHAARSGRRAGRRSLGPRDRKEARRPRGDLPSLEKPLRRDE